MPEVKEQQNHKLYENLVWVYDFLFKPFFIEAIKKVMIIVEEISPDSVLEVGVGTGYSLEFYPEGTSVVGVDVSDEMVKASRKKALKISNKNIEVYNIKDLAPEILKESVSVVVSFSVLTVVADPQEFIEELKSYCEPEGHIILIMHIRGDGFLGWVDRVFDFPMRKFFGFTLLRRISEYNLEGLEVVEERPISHIFFYPYSHLVVLKKVKQRGLI